MSAVTDHRDEKTPETAPRNEELVSMPRCARCNLSYLPAKSTSALKLTYCSFLCELGDLGFSIAGLETMELVKKGEDEEDAEVLEPEPAVP